jgi:PAS domain S-box-containing protein
MSSSDTKYSKREPSETELQRVNRALRVASNANKSLAMASDDIAWLNQICRSALEVGGYRMAWVGFAEQDKKKTVRPVAHAGFEAGYLEAVNITWMDEPRGRGPTGTAIRTGQHCIARNITSELAFKPWRDAAVKRKYKSTISLPLKEKERTFGVLAVYAEEVDAFGDKEVEVLQELANDLAFGLTVGRRARNQSQFAIKALEESQRKLGQVERISHLAQWGRDLETNILTWSDELYRILGLEPQIRIFHFSEFVALVHPEDRAGVLKVAEEAVKKLGRFHLDYRVIRPDGQLRYIHGEGEVIRDEGGQPRRTVGFLQDVTEQILAKTALEKANRSLEMKNIAMEEVLGNIKAERDKIGQRVTKNVGEIILPLLQSLRQGATRQQQRGIDQIDNCLQEIISPFIDKVGHAVTSLTPTELRFCSFIKRGMSVKQIADLEHLSPETISAHRRNIRRKLNIANRKINLTSYLRDIYRDPATPKP